MKLVNEDQAAAVIAGNRIAVADSQRVNRSVVAERSAAHRREQAGRPSRERCMPVVGDWRRASGRAARAMSEHPAASV